MVYGPVAQLVEHFHGMEGVRGSSPLRSTIRLALLAHGVPPELSSE